VDNEEISAAVEMAPQEPNENVTSNGDSETLAGSDALAPVGEEAPVSGSETVLEMQTPEDDDAADSTSTEPTEDDSAPEAEAGDSDAAADSEDTEAEGEQEPSDEEEAGPPRQWFVVHGYSGYENRVKKNLEQRIESMGMQDRIFQVVVPTEEEIEIKGGERRVVERRVFPGYILVEMVMDESSWYVVRNTPGVTGFVGTGSRPTPLSEEEVDKIMKRIEAAEPTIKVSFKVGQQVRLTDGAFADFVGRVDELYPEKGRAKVLVSMFGRDTPLEVELLHLERV
jgi:transcriptional antiterminator NusG